MFDPIQHEPVLRARLGQRHRARLGRAADRRQDGPGHVGVARARPRSAVGIERRAARQRLSLGLRAHELGRPRLIRATCCCRSRNTWALYDVDIAQRRACSWRLGGKRSSFKLGAGTREYWQHDAEFQPGGLISVFDNARGPAQGEAVAGLLLRPDTASHTVTSSSIHQPLARRCSPPARATR